MSSLFILQNFQLTLYCSTMLLGRCNFVSMNLKGNSWCYKERCYVTFINRKLVSLYSHWILSKAFQTYISLKRHQIIIACLGTHLDLRPTLYKNIQFIYIMSISTCFCPDLKSFLYLSPTSFNCVFAGHIVLQAISNPLCNRVGDKYK